MAGRIGVSDVAGEWPETTFDFEAAVLDYLGGMTKPENV